MDHPRVQQFTLAIGWHTRGGKWTASKTGEGGVGLEGHIDLLAQTPMDSGITTGRAVGVPTW